MTSEGSHRPGQEPDEVSPGAGGPAPYGDRNAQQNSPYGAPDLGWAPPPPANRPQSPAPAWAPQNDQPATAAWGAAPSAQPGEPTPAPGTWGPAAGTSQAAWAQQEQSGAWGTAAQQTPEQDQPAWGQQAPQAAPGWPQQQAAARGAAQVPQPGAPAPGGWPAADESPQGGGWNGAGQQDDQARSGGWNGAPDNPATSGGWPADARQDDASRPGWNDGQDDAARSGGWNRSTEDDPSRSGGWNAGGQQDDPARSGGWRANAAPQDDQPAWAQQAAQAAPAWPQAQPAARGAAQVPQPAAPAQDAHPGQDDPARSGGWQQQDRGPQADPATSGGWNAPQEDPARSGGWNRSTEDDAARPGGWNGSNQDDQARSGGWNDSAQDDAARPGGWNDSAQDDAARSGGWNGAAQGDAAASGGWNAGAGQPAVGRGSAAVPQQQNGERSEQDWPASDEPASGGGWATAAAVPQPGDRGDNAHWPRTEPTSAPPARATATVTGDEGPPPWTGPAAENAGQWGAERTARQDGPETAASWSPGDGWNRQEAEPAAENGWEPHRAEEPPAYQPGPAPGISPANAVPLPPQEQRVPGASLAAAPPADYSAPAQYSPFEQPGRDDAGRGYPSEQGGDAWGGADAARDEPQSPAGPLVPGPRTSPESGRASVPGVDPNAGSASASASVPTASRVTPPTDQPVHPGGNQPPQPRVYGRPARPEPEQDEPEQDEPGHEQGQQQHYDDQDRPPASRAYAAAVPVTSGPPAPPAFPQGMPNFVDPAGNNRPMNGTRPHPTDERAGDPYGAGRPLDGTQPYGQPAVGEQHQGGFPPAFPGAQQNAFPGGQQNAFPGAQQGGFPGGQPDGPSWGAPTEPEQGRFDSFKPEPEPKAEQPVPKVRNGRVLAVVLLVAVAILAIPLGLLALLGKLGGENESAPKFNPAVGSCVKRSGTTAATATCGEPGSFTVVSKVDNKKPCADPGQPHVVLPDGTTKLCLKPAPTK